MTGTLKGKQIKVPKIIIQETTSRKPDNRWRHMATYYMEIGLIRYINPHRMI